MTVGLFLTQISPVCVILYIYRGQTSPLQKTGKSLMSSSSLSEKVSFLAWLNIMNVFNLEYLIIIYCLSNQIYE